MMHIADIEDALDDRNLGIIEVAFRLLVQWRPDETVAGAENARDLTCLLDRVTSALEADKTSMPSDLAESIIQATQDGFWLRDDRSYATGARVVAATSLRWHALFADRVNSDEVDVKDPSR